MQIGALIGRASVSGGVMSDGPEPTFPVLGAGPGGASSSHPKVGATDRPTPRFLFQSPGQIPTSADTSIDERVWAAAAVAAAIIAMAGRIFMFTDSPNDEAAGSSTSAAPGNSASDGHSNAGGLRAGFTPFGQTRWPKGAQARFASRLRCVPDAEPVIDFKSALCPAFEGEDYD